VQFRWIEVPLTEGACHMADKEKPGGMSAKRGGSKKKKKAAKKKG
jgi:hypothetical protein